MSDGTSFMAEVYLSHMLFRTKDQLIEKIQETEDNISFIRERILMFSVSTPKDIYLSEAEEGEKLPTNEELVSSIHEIVDDLFTWLEEEMRLMNNLYLFMETLENNPEKDISEYFPFKEGDENETL